MYLFFVFTVRGRSYFLGRGFDGGFFSFLSWRIVYFVGGIIEIFG